MTLPLLSEKCGNCKKADVLCDCDCHIMSITNGYHEYAKDEPRITKNDINMTYQRRYGSKWNLRKLLTRLRNLV